MALEGTYVYQRVQRRQATVSTRMCQSAGHPLNLESTHVVTKVESSSTPASPRIMLCTYFSRQCDEPPPSIRPKILPVGCVSFAESGL